ncbi:GNAT family N-acetyltransferase [Planococcus soli]|uniref:GNAT family N-acetyltransferase n=1 Tax=Planococcus soli TaxID=2666072 RepID=UPI00115D323E|nr:GNAT family protein [Planococcus soli]
MDKPNAFPTIESKRLILRQATEEDAENVLAYLSNEKVTRHMGIEPFESRQDAIDEISWYRSIFEKNTGIRWGITLKGQDKVIGSCGFLNLKAQHHRSEIGFELSEEYWGIGIASEAFQAVIAYGFETMNLQRIEALVEPANISSQKLVEKQVFQKEGLLRSYEFTAGKYDDLYMYSLLKQEFSS